MVGDALLQREALPEYPAGGGARVELRDLRGDEEVIVLLRELHADVNRLVLQDGPVLFHPRSLWLVSLFDRKNVREPCTPYTNAPRLHHLEVLGPRGLDRWVLRRVRCEAT